MGTGDHDLSEPYRGAHGVMQMLTKTTAPNFQVADLILWPEVSRAVYCGCDIFEDRGMARTTRLANGPIALACLENTPPAEKGTPSGGNVVRYDVYNTLMQVDETQCRIVYRKHRLVPFGEAAPLRDRWPWLYNKMARQMEYVPGPGPDVFSLPQGSRVQPLICFESGFPEMTRAGVALGAHAFVNVSNDAWFMSARAAELHLSLALFRAVEQRRPLVRGTNSGFGAHIKATGEIVPGSITPMNERAVRQANLYIPKEVTIYHRIGDAWLWLAALLVLGRIGQAGLPFFKRFR